MRQFSKITVVLTWLATAAAPAHCLAVPAAAPQTPQLTAALLPPLPVIRRLPRIANSQLTAYSLDAIAEFDQQRPFDASPDNSFDRVLSFDRVFEVPAATPGKPGVNGWIQVGYGAGWIIQ